MDDRNLLQFARVTTYKFSKKYNTFVYILMADQEFQLLISTADYLKLQKQCGTLKTDNQKLLQEKKQLSEKVHLLIEDNASLRQKMVFLEEGNEKFHRQLQKMIQNAAILEQEKEELKKSIGINKKKYEAQQQASLTLQRQLEKQMAQLRTRSSKLEKESQDLMNELMKIRQRQFLDKTTQTFSFGRDTMTMTEESSFQTEMKLKIFQKQVDDLVNTITELKKKLKFSQSQYQKLRQSHEELDHQNLKMKEQIDDLECHIHQLRTTIKDQNSEKGKLSSTIFCLEEEVKNLYKEVSDRKNEIQSLRCMVDLKEMELKELKMLHRKLQEKNQCVEEDFELKLEQSVAECASLQQKIFMMEKQSDSLRTKIRQLESRGKQSNEWQSKCEDVELQFTFLMDKIGEYEDTVKKMKMEIKEEKRLQEEYESMIESLNKELEMAEKELHKNKGKKKSEKMGSLGQIKMMIEDHFSTFIINLSDMDSSLSEGEVRNLLQEELDIVRKFLRDAVDHLLTLKFQKKK